MFDKTVLERDQLLTEICVVGVFSDGVFVFVVDDRFFPADLFVLATLGENGRLGNWCVNVHEVVEDFSLDKGSEGLRMHREMNDTLLKVRVLENQVK